MFTAWPNFYLLDGAFWYLPVRVCLRCPLAPVLTASIHCLCPKPRAGSEFSTSLGGTTIRPKLQTGNLEDSLDSTFLI